MTAPASGLRRLNAVAAEGAVVTVVALAGVALLTELGALAAFGTAVSIGTLAMLVGMSVPWPRPPIRPALARLGGRLAAAGNLGFLLIVVIGSVAFGAVADWLAWLLVPAALAAVGLVALHLAAKP